MRVLSALPLVMLLLATPAALPAQSPPSHNPDPAAVQRYGPAYRYPQAGWTVLHIEGEPYERGYQHGRLMATEIAGYLRCFASLLSPKAAADDWGNTRRLVNALFLRRFEREFLEEMKGIADGATEAGGRFYNRNIDLVDIVALNCWPEIETLDSALEATPTGLEGIRFPKAQPRAMPKPRPEHCSAFAATGPATADGKIVFGHITMFGLYPANFYNVWLDIKPAKGRRCFMSCYPGAMQSGMDYYMNDAGLLICETTVAQTRFDITGQALTSRIRQAVQYATSIDEAAAILKKSNNGLYSNEWLLADVNTNEIAMLTLGTHTAKLRRSSKQEWIGGTAGFYWGCNNSTDFDHRLETIASVQGRPANLVFRPSDRDQAWQRLYQKHKGKIGVEFGFEAFTTPPVAAYHSLDAKFTTTDLAKQLKTWALFGPPLGRTWQPTASEKQRYPEVKPLVSNPWTVLNGSLPPKTTIVAADISGTPPAPFSAAGKKKGGKRKANLLHVPAWHGTILPASDGDLWLASAFANYERIVAAQKSRGHTAQDHDALALDLFGYRTSYLTAARQHGDLPLAAVKADVATDAWYRIASGKGVLLLHALRSTLGETVFDDAMESFGSAHAGSRVTSAQFQAHVEKAAGRSLANLFDPWLNKAGLPADPIGGSVYSCNTFYPEQDRTLIVYGTLDERPTNHEAALALQKGLRESGPNFTVPIKSDKEVSPADLKSNHLLLIGRPDSNILIESYHKSLPLTFGQRSFTVRGQTYAHPGSAFAAVADNPMNPRYSMVVLAGLSAEATYHLPGRFLGGRRAAEVLLLPNGGGSTALIVSKTP